MAEDQWAEFRTKGPATDDQWAEFRQSKNVAADMAKSGGIGLVEGGIGLAGLPGDIGTLISAGVDKAGSALGISPETINRTKDVARLGARTNPLTGSLVGPGSADIQKAVEEKTGAFYKPQTTAGEYARTIGQFAPGALIPGGAAMRAANVVVPAMASEAAGQYTKGKDAEPYARIAGALAGGLAPSAFARVVTPNPVSPARQRLVDILEGEGVTSTTAGQRTGSEPLRYAESVLGNAPFSGGRANAITREGQEQFTEAAMRRAGAGPDATPETLLANNRRLGDEFRDLSARNTLNFDPQFGNDLGAAIRSYERVPPSQQRAVVENYVNDIVTHANQGGMPGTNYQEMRSRLSRQANSLRNSDPTLSEALRDMRNALDNAMRRSISPADREAWDLARQQYGAQKTIEKAASRAGEATGEGQIVPANLRNAASAENRGAYARGEGQFSELARAGSAVMAPMPQSGTAPRSMLYNISNVATAGLLPAAVGRVLMSRPVQGYLGNQLLLPQARQHPRIEDLARALLASEPSRPQIAN